MGVEKIPCCHWGESQTVHLIVSYSTNYAILAANSAFCPASTCAYIDTPDVKKNVIIPVSGKFYFEKILKETHIKKIISLKHISICKRV